MRAALSESRDFLVSGLEAEGFGCLAAEGSYFVSIDLDASGIPADDLAFCERAVREAGVAAIPISAFYDEAPVTNVVRLCFAKKRETLAEGILRLRAAKALFTR